jgi:hypothetical protein
MRLPESDDCHARQGEANANWCDRNMIAERAADPIQQKVA